MLPNNIQSILDEKFSVFQEKVQAGATIDPSLWTFLSESEQLLIQLMSHNTPGPTAPGDNEFSWVLYTLNHKVSEKWVEILRIAGMPHSAIQPNEWTQWMLELEGEGTLMGDGSWVSTALYGVLDPGWVQAILYYFLFDLDITTKHPFTNTPKVTTITQDTLSLALFGDWGTGQYQDGNLSSSPSQQVMQQIAAKNPDVMIHLGDVYYAGLGSQEQEKLLDCWKSARLGNFTLNSNHEMYDGGLGLYNVALNSPLFAAQNQSTFFAIRFNEWVILGLDSAYNATKFYMDGAIAGSEQKDFVDSLNLTKDNKLLVLTHHNPIDVQGLNPNALWTDVVKNTLGGTEPDMWYWGHIHNGAMYQNLTGTGKTK
ncbi:MAG: metallophosphoesterase, partial [Cyclobacteriaceae bacterium]